MFYSTHCLPCRWLFCLPCQWLLPIYSVQPANFTAKYTTVDKKRGYTMKGHRKNFCNLHFMEVLQTTSMRCFLLNYHFSWDFGLTIQQPWQLQNPMILSSTLPDGTFQIHLTRKGAHHVFGWIPINTEPLESSSNPFWLSARLSLKTRCDKRSNLVLGRGRPPYFFSSA